MCDKQSTPSVSSISRLLRGSRSSTSDDGSSDGGLVSVGLGLNEQHRQHDHTIDGILAGKDNPSNECKMNMQMRHIMQNDLNFKWPKMKAQSKFHSFKQSN